MKKKWIISLLIFILVAAIILLCPVPQRINRTYTAQNTQNGEVATIELEATYWRFLVLKDTIKATFTVRAGETEKEYGKDLFYAGFWPSNNADGELHAFTGWYFNNEMVEYDYGDGNIGTNVIGSELLHAYLSPDFNRIVLYHEPDRLAQDTEVKQYVGYTENNTLEETLEYFTGYVK